MLNCSGGSGQITSSETELPTRGIPLADYAGACGEEHISRCRVAPVGGSLSSPGTSSQSSTLVLAQTTKFRIRDSVCNDKQLVPSALVQTEA